ncbi:MAG: GWxTD domain-containing protein [Candidatus Eisenbacteria bacterium]|nr:GWxTD domain-containing protein [Candidatus Eisenbacteria bacterium]
MTRLLPVAVLVLSVAATSAPLAQPIDMGTPESIGGLRFAVDVAVAPSAAGGGIVRINYAVTYDALPFLRYGDGYRARYELTAILYDDGRQVTGDSWRGSVDVDTYDETNARRTAVADVIEFAVDPGRYTLKVELGSIDTKAVGRVERRVTVPRMEPGKLTIGTLVFEKGPSADESGLAGAMLNPTRIYGEDQPVARVRVPVYGVAGATYSVDLSVLDERGSLHKGIADTVVQSGFLTEYEWQFSVLDMEVGYYVLEAEVRPLPRGDKSEAKARFRVVTSPLSWGQDPDKMLDQISYVATREEVERLASVAPEDRDPIWEEFWASHDPDPLTDENEFRIEFLRRLGYANARFRSIVEGWQTDMGRIYIQYGEPDDVDSQPIGQMLNAWEIWYYYSEHTKYVFIDRQGFGEFVLYETSRI